MKVVEVHASRVRKPRPKKSTSQKRKNRAEKRKTVQKEAAPPKIVDKRPFENEEQANMRPSQLPLKLYQKLDWLMDKLYEVDCKLKVRA